MIKVEREAVEQGNASCSAILIYCNQMLVKLKSTRLGGETHKGRGTDWVWHKEGEHFMVGHARCGKLISSRAWWRQCAEGTGIFPISLWCDASQLTLNILWHCVLIWFYVIVRVGVKERERSNYQSLGYLSREVAIMQPKKKRLWCVVVV